MQFTHFEHRAFWNNVRLGDQVVGMLGGVYTVVELYGRIDDSRPATIVISRDGINKITVNEERNFLGYVTAAQWATGIVNNVARPSKGFADAERHVDNLATAAGKPVSGSNDMLYHAMIEIAYYSTWSHGGDNLPVMALPEQIQGATGKLGAYLAGAGNELNIATINLLMQVHHNAALIMSLYFSSRSL